MLEITARSLSVVTSTLNSALKLGLSMHGKTFLRPAVRDPWSECSRLRILTCTVRGANPRIPFRRSQLQFRFLSSRGYSRQRAWHFCRPPKRDILSVHNYLGNDEPETIQRYRGGWVLDMNGLMAFEVKLLKIKIKGKVVGFDIQENALAPDLLFL